MIKADLFVIAAGGTGAKVVEAIVHLCAAGLCPPNVHILLVDGDASNGNRKRALETWNTYQQVQPWPWLVKPETADGAEVSLFGSKLEIYALAEQFSSAESGSLRPLVQEDSKLLEALGVLLDDQELDMNMRMGFTGRPNLGCLVMNHYLRRHLRSHDRAQAFIQALEDSARRSDLEPPRAMVVGSVFGGTGASLLPIAKASVRSVFSEPDANGQPRIGLFNKIHWGKIMLLPYFRPQGGVNLGMVNPARHFVDTSGALWYYGLGRADPEPVYLIGSDGPDKRKIAAVGGEMGQNNPACYHELITALAVLDFHAAPEVQGNHPIRHFSESAQLGATPEDNSLFALPGPAKLGQERVRTQLAWLFHLAAFSIDWRANPAAEFHKGLFQYAKEAELTGWDPAINDPWVGHREDLKKKGKDCQQVLEYFARLLLWSKGVLSSPEYSSSGLAFNTDPGQYASLQNTMCHLRRGEIKVSDQETVPQRPDNLAARICRLGLSGLAREEASKAHNHRGHALALERNQLFFEGHTIRVGLGGTKSLAEALATHGFEKTDVASWFREFQVVVPQD